MKTFGDLLDSMNNQYTVSTVLGRLQALSKEERSEFRGWYRHAHRSSPDWFMKRLTSNFDLDALTADLYDRTYVTCGEVNSVAKNLRSVELCDIFLVFEDGMPEDLREQIRGFAYHLPSMGYVRPDWYITNLPSVPPTRLDEVSALLEGNGTDDFAVKTHFSYKYLCEIPSQFMVNVLGIKNFTERDIVLVKWAFTKVHVKDAWITASVLFGCNSPAQVSRQLDITETAVHSIIACTIRKVKELMGLNPDDNKLTRMSAVEREVSPRLFRTINKAVYFEDLIDPSTGYIKPSTSSVDLVEELLWYCHSHGYPNANIGWANGKGVVIYTKGSGTRA